MPNIAGDCPSCIDTFNKLDALLEAAINREVEATITDKTNARLHTLAAVESWWMDRMLNSFPSRTGATTAIRWCLNNVMAEQGVRL